MSSPFSICLFCTHRRMMPVTHRYFLQCLFENAQCNLFLNLFAGQSCEGCRIRESCWNPPFEEDHGPHPFAPFLKRCGVCRPPASLWEWFLPPGAWCTKDEKKRVLFGPPLVHICCWQCDYCIWDVYRSAVGCYKIDCTEDFYLCIIKVCRQSRKTFLFLFCFFFLFFY